MSKNRILELMNEKLARRGQKALAGDEPTPQPPQPVRYLPGGLDVFAQNLDQPEPDPVGEVELARKARLADAAWQTGAGYTAAERHAAARAKAKAKGLYQR